MNSFSDQDLKALIFLNKLLATNASWPISLSENERPQEVLESVLNNPVFLRSETFLKIRKTFNSEQELENCRKNKIQLLTYLDADYPLSLKNILSPPPLLYVKGNTKALNHSAVAVVGSREATFYGLDQARKFGEKLAGAGFCVVSGLAKGIDQAAHQGCLKTQGAMTAAVLGCGIDRAYPRGSEKLSERICENGAVISEYPLGTQPLAHHFPRRNRIISGLSLGVLVVEAHLKSGSLITAYTALEQGKDVFAIPGPVDRLTSQGTHRLIKEGAVLTETVEDIISALNYHLPSEAVEPLRVNPVLPAADSDKMLFKPGSEEKPEAGKASLPKNRLYKLLQQKACSFDELLAAGTCGPGQLAASLLEMELSHKVKRDPSGRYRPEQETPGI